MALSHDFDGLRIKGSAVGDWVFSAGSPSSTKYYTYYNYVTDENEYVQYFRYTAAVTIQSAPVDLTARTVVRVVPVGCDAPAVSGGASYNRRKFLVSDDGGTTYYKKSGSTWAPIGIGSIALEGMTGPELVAAGLPTTRNNIRIATYVPAGYNTSNAGAFMGFNVVTGSYDTGYQKLYDFTGESVDYNQGGYPTTPRLDYTHHWLLDFVGSYTTLSQGQNEVLNESNGCIFRDSTPSAGTYSLGYFTCDVSQTVWNRGYRIETTEDVDESKWICRLLVSPTTLGEFEYPEHKTWYAWDGSTWGEVAAGDYNGDPETYGMTIEQFNDARWSELTSANGLTIWLYGNRIANVADPDIYTDDWWIEGLYGYTVMSSYETGKTPPTVTVGTEGGNPEPVNNVFGWARGRVCRSSDVRGEMLPPEPVTVRGVVSEYQADPLETDRPYFIASSLDADGSASYFGMPAEPPDAVDGYWWWGSADGLDDWSNGLIAHVYDDSASSSGAAGQWMILAGRDPSDPYKFYLERPLATAPQLGDKFHIGQLVWIVFPEVGTAPPHSLVQLDVGEITMKLLRGTLRATMEVYPSGENFEVASPVYPLRAANHKIHDITQTEMRTTAIRDYAHANGFSGAGTSSREISLAFVTIVDRGDFKLEKVCYKVDVIS